MNKHSFLTEINHRLSFAITRLAVLATLCLAQIVWAQTESDVPYLDANSVKRYANNVTLITSANIATINNLDGWYLVRGVLPECTATLTVSGTAHIILEDGSNLRVTGNAGSAINVSASSTSNSSLTIYAQSTDNNMGKLTATGSGSGAGIGNSSLSSGGVVITTTITINGGTITATGGSDIYNGAGIGGRGQAGSGGTIIINGGTVMAIGGSGWMGGGAGIGGSSYGGSSGTITINGGTVTAIGGDSNNDYRSGGAGIGSGGSFCNGDVGTITISGGIVTATGGNGNGCGIPAGIGSDSQSDKGILVMRNSAVVFASSVSGNSYSRVGGILVIGNTTNWYSNNLTLSPIQYTIPSGYTLTIPSGRTLTIPDGATLINNGTVIPADNSTIVIDGTRTSKLIQGANASVPTLASRTSTSITINEATLLAETGQAMEYAINTAYTAPSSGWQMETTFAELNEGTSYYVFARSQANTNFAAGASSRARIAVATDLSFTIPAGHIYSGKTQGIGTVSPRSGVGGMGTITVLYNGSTTAPTNAGTYEVTANIAEGEEFAAVEGVVLGEYAIAPKPIKVTAAGKTKVYGTADPALTYSVAPALASGDNLSGELSRAEGENVGDYDISQGTLAANGNYELTFAGANFAITPMPIAIAAEAKTKVYGSPDPELTYTAAPELINDDTFSGELSRAEGENVGDYAISQGSLTAGGNYELTFTSANFAITTKSITATGLSASNKTYDGTATAAVAGTAVISGAIDGDDVTVVCTASFANKNVGTDKAVSFNCSPSGTNGGNYTLSAQPANVTADINAKPITVTAAAGQSKAYGTLDHEFAYSVEPTLAAGDNFGGELSRAEGENIGSYAINQGTLTAGNNYSITFESANFAITAKPVTITGVSAASKEYDGRTAATVTGTATVSGKVGSDDVTVVGGTASFADKKAGTGKSVAFSGFSLGGTAADNYELTAQPASVAANITARPVTITGVTVHNKEYDGTATATVTGTATVSVTVGSDDVTAVCTASFADSNAGIGKPVTFNCSLGGTDAGNYVLSAQPASVTADIHEADSPSSSSADPSSSSADIVSSSSGNSTPIARHAPSAINSETQTYYTIKGEPVGSVKPAKPGVYLVKQGNSIRKIVVR
jgi:hypothetical protein